MQSSVVLLLEIHSWFAIGKLVFPRETNAPFFVLLKLDRLCSVVSLIVDEVLLGLIFIVYVDATILLMKPC